MAGMDGICKKDLFMYYSDESGVKNFLTRVGLGQFFLLLGLGQPSMIWVWKISLKNGKFFNFNFFHSGRVKKYPGQRWVSLLFTVGQK